MESAFTLANRTASTETILIRSVTLRSGRKETGEEAISIFERGSPFHESSRGINSPAQVVIHGARERLGKFGVDRADLGKCILFPVRVLTPLLDADAATPDDDQLAPRHGSVQAHDASDARGLNLRESPRPLRIHESRREPLHSRCRRFDP